MPIYIDFPSGGFAAGFYPEEIEEKKVMLNKKEKLHEKEFEFEK